MPDDDDLDPATPPLVPPAVPPVVPPAAPLPPVPPVVPLPVPTPSASESDRRALIADHQQRGASKALKKFFGTDDPAEIERIQADRQAKLDEHQALVAAQEAKKREQMSEVDRLNADVLRLTQENTDLKAQLQQVKNDKLAAEQDSRIRGIAVNHVQPKWLKYAMAEFRDYVLSLPPADMKKVDDRRTDRWFLDFAKREPTCALEAVKPPAPPAEPPAPPVAKPPGTPPQQRPPIPAGARPPGLGAKPNTPPASADPFAGYTPLPGKPNSMPKAMLRDYAKANGLPYLG